LTPTRNMSSGNFTIEDKSDAVQAQRVSVTQFEAKVMQTDLANAIQAFTDPVASPMTNAAPPPPPRDRYNTPADKVARKTEFTAQPIQPPTAMFDPLGGSKFRVFPSAQTTDTFAGVAATIAGESLAPVNPGGKRFVNYGALHAAVLNVITPKPRIISKYSYAGICKPLNPDPLGMAPYGVRIHTHEFVESAFDPEYPTVPKFLVAVVGSFPTLDKDFHKKIYSDWKEARKNISELCTSDLTDEEGIELRAMLDEVVASRAFETRKFISAALAVYKGKNAENLPKVVDPWLRPFYTDIDTRSSFFGFP